MPRRFTSAFPSPTIATFAAAIAGPARCRTCPLGHRDRRRAAGNGSPDRRRVSHVQGPRHGRRTTDAKDVPQLVARLRAQMPHVELALSTNALLLAQSADELRRAGIDSINISIDSLEPETFRDLTRGGNVNAVLDGIRRRGRPASARSASMPC